ncbi:MAG: hypothetical protein K0R97_1507, partial [Oerskovia sp.]|nr:hypothetical protein [Oerskovia sp.]
MKRVARSTSVTTTSTVPAGASLSVIRPSRGNAVRAGRCVPAP